MKEEVEVKLKVSGLKRLEKMLLEKGASVLAKDVTEVDVYFEHPCRKFLETDEALRVRVSNHTVTLTYKGPRAKGEIKRRREITVTLGDVEKDDVLDLLETLGFKRVAVVRKKRSYYRLDKVVVSLDYVEGLGEFVELELVGPEANSNELVKLASDLGLEWSPVQRTYLEMLLEEGVEKT